MKFNLKVLFLLVGLVFGSSVTVFSSEAAESSNGSVQNHINTNFKSGPGGIGIGDHQWIPLIADIESYDQDTVKKIGNWEEQDSQGYDPFRGVSYNIWKFKTINNEYLTMSWIESMSEKGTWYFVNAFGEMIVNNYTADGYYVDENGIWKSYANEGLIISN